MPTRREVVEGRVTEGAALVEPISQMRWRSHGYEHVCDVREEELGNPGGEPQQEERGSTGP